MNNIAPEALAKMPPEWWDELTTASCTYDAERTWRILARVPSPPQPPSTRNDLGTERAIELLDWIRKFSFDAATDDYTIDTVKEKIISLFPGIFPPSKTRERKVYETGGDFGGTVIISSSTAQAVNHVTGDKEVDLLCAKVLEQEKFISRLRELAAEAGEFGHMSNPTSANKFNERCWEMIRILSAPSETGEEVDNGK